MTTARTFPLNDKLPAWPMNAVAEMLDNVPLYDWTVADVKAVGAELAKAERTGVATDREMVVHFNLLARNFFGHRS